MKNLKNLLTVACTLLISNFASAQTCNATISNSTNCTAHGYIEWYDCNNNVCTYTPFTEVAGSVASPYTCSTCTTVCDVKFVVQYLGGSLTPGSYPFVNSVQTNDTGTSPCNPPAFNITVTYSSSSDLVIY